MPGDALACNNHSTRAIAEQYASRAIIPIQNARQHFRANHQRSLGLSAAYVQVCGIHGIDETAAHSLHVEGRATIFDAEFVLQNTGRAGENLIRSRGCHNHQINLVSTDARCLYGSQAGLQGKIAAQFVVRRDMPLMNAATRYNPVVRRFNKLFQVEVGQYFGGQIAAGADNS